MKKQANRVIIPGLGWDIIDNINEPSGPLFFPGVRYQPMPELAKWLRDAARTFDLPSLPIDKELGVEVTFEVEDDNAPVVRIDAEITPAGMLELAITYEGTDGETWVENSTHHGVFHVWWVNDQGAP